MKREEFIVLVKKYVELSDMCVKARWAYDRCLDVKKKSSAMARWCYEIGEESIAREARAIHEYISSFCPKLKDKYESIYEERLKLRKTIADSVNYWCTVELDMDRIDLIPLLRCDDMDGKEPLLFTDVAVAFINKDEYVVLCKHKEVLPIEKEAPEEMCILDVLRVYGKLHEAGKFIKH